MVSVGVHVRAEDQLVLPRTDLNGPPQVPALEPRLELESVRLDRLDADFALVVVVQLPGRLRSRWRASIRLRTRTYLLSVALFDGWLIRKSKSYTTVWTDVVPCIPLSTESSNF